MTDWNVYDQYKDREIWNLTDQLATFRARKSSQAEVDHAIEEWKRGMAPYQIEVKIA